MARHHDDHHHRDKIAGGAGVSFFTPETPAHERGAIGTSTLKTLHINPEELEHTENFDRGAEIVRDYLESKMPGVTRDADMNQLGYVYKFSRDNGPFAANGIFKEPQTGADICLVNAPDKSFAHGEPILKAFGISGNPDEGTGFDPRHMRDLPGSAEALAEIIGMHEGEHCNQVRKDGDMEKLQREILADRTALGRMRERGENDTVQALVDIRAVAAANGDAIHATGIFLDQERFEGVNKEMLDAATGFKDKMVEDVASRLSISQDDAEKLRLDNPRAFRNEIEKSLAEGRFDETGNKYTKRYIEAYSGAVDRLVKDETPPLERAKTSEVPDPDIEERTLEDAEAEDKRLADEAKEHEAAAESEDAEADAESEAEAEDPDAEAEPVVGEEAQSLFNRLMSKPTEVSMASPAQTASPAPKSDMARPAMAAPTV